MCYVVVSAPQGPSGGSGLCNTVLRDLDLVGLGGFRHIDHVLKDVCLSMEDKNISSRQHASLDLYWH